MMGFKRGQKSEKKRPEQWVAGDDVRRLAEDIIGESHPHLADADILYAMRYPSWKKNGKTVGGCAALATPADKMKTGRKDLSFIITLNSEEWERANALHQRALLDHELCHCEYDYTKSEEDGESPWKMVGHDVEDFTEIITRHGLWHDDLRLFADEVGRQLELGLGAAPAKKRARGGSKPRRMDDFDLDAAVSEARAAGREDLAQLMVKLDEVSKDRPRAREALRQFNRLIAEEPTNTVLTTARDFLVQQLDVHALTDVAIEHIERMRPAEAARETRGTTEETAPPGEPVN